MFSIIGVNPIRPDAPSPSLVWRHHCLSVCHVNKNVAIKASKLVPSTQTCPFRPALPRTSKLSMSVSCAAPCSSADAPTSRCGKTISFLNCTQPSHVLYVRVCACSFFTQKRGHQSFKASPVDPDVPISPSTAPHLQVVHVRVLRGTVLFGRCTDLAMRKKYHF